MERLLKECLKQFEEVKDPKLEKSYQSLIKGVESDLLALKKNTEEVLKNTELMRNGLDSLR
jgi:aryl carrier-like protein